MDPVIITVQRGGETFPVQAKLTSSGNLSFRLGAINHILTSEMRVMHVVPYAYGGTSWEYSPTVTATPPEGFVFPSLPPRHLVNRHPAEEDLRARLRRDRVVGEIRSILVESNRRDTLVAGLFHPVDGLVAFYQRKGSRIEVQPAPGKWRLKPDEQHPDETGSPPSP